MSAAPAFTHPVRVESIRPGRAPVELDLGQAARERLAKALDLPSIESLKARYELTRLGERVRVEGRITSALHQLCVVTLEPFPVRADVPVALVFAPEAAAPVTMAEAAEIELDLESDDPPEPLVGNAIDLGAVTQEFLALSLDPYPRKPGVSFDADAVSDAPESPFAALAKLKPRDEA